MSDTIQELLAHLTKNEAIPKSMSGLEISLAEVTSAISSSIMEDGYFPPNATPDSLGDGSILQKRGEHCYYVYDRHEIGIMRYSKVSTRRFFTLRGAAKRFLKHYRSRFKAHNITIRWWS